MDKICPVGIFLFHLFLSFIHPVIDFLYGMQAIASDSRAIEIIRRTDLMNRKRPAWPWQACDTHTDRH